MVDECHATLFLDEINSLLPLKLLVAKCSAT
jgi:hypothetical protein